MLAKAQLAQNKDPEPPIEEQAKIKSEENKSAAKLDSENELEEVQDQDDSSMKTEIDNDDQDKKRASSGSSFRTGRSFQAIPRSSDSDSSSSSTKDKGPTPTILDCTLSNNPQIATTLTDQLITQVTSSMIQVNTSELEVRLKELVMKLMTEPLAKIELQEEILSKYAQSQRRTVRRVHEVEYVMQKYQRAQIANDALDRRVAELEAQLAQQNSKYDEQIRFLTVYCKEDISDKLQSYCDELENWKRWFIRIQREFDSVVDSQKTDKQILMAQMKMAFDQTAKNISELHKNQLNTDRDVVVMKSMVTDHNESVTMTEMKVEVLEKKYKRQNEEFDRKMGDLGQRIDKAEKDRMHRYYGQVSQINDWVISVKQKIEDSAQMCDSLGNYFQSEHQIYTMNLITETLSKCLEGRSLNAMIDEVRGKQNRVGQRKLSMLKNSRSDRLNVAQRFLNTKQPFYPMPAEIPEEDLPLTFEGMMLKLTRQMEGVRARQSIRASPERTDKKNTRNSMQMVSGSSRKRSSKADYQDGVQSSNKSKRKTRKVSVDVSSLKGFDYPSYQKNNTQLNKNRLSKVSEKPLEIEELKQPENVKVKSQPPVTRKIGAIDKMISSLKRQRVSRLSTFHEQEPTQVKKKTAEQIDTQPTTSLPAQKPDQIHMIASQQSEPVKLTVSAVSKVGAQSEKPTITQQDELEMDPDLEETPAQQEDGSFVQNLAEQFEQQEQSMSQIKDQLAKMQKIQTRKERDQKDLAEKYAQEKKQLQEKLEEKESNNAGTLDSSKLLMIEHLAAQVKNMRLQLEKAEADVAMNRENIEQIVEKRLENFDKSATKNTDSELCQKSAILKISDSELTDRRNLKQQSSKRKSQVSHKSVDELSQTMGKHLASKKSLHAPSRPTISKLKSSSQMSENEDDFDDPSGENSSFLEVTSVGGKLQMVVKSRRSDQDQKSYRSSQSSKKEKKKSKKAQEQQQTRKAEVKDGILADSIRGSEQSLQDDENGGSDQKKFYPVYEASSRSSQGSSQEQDRKQRHRQRNSNSSESGISSSSSSSSSDNDGKFNEKHADWARNIMEDLKEEWREEDDVRYASRDEMNNRIENIDNRLNSFGNKLKEFGELMLQEQEQAKVQRAQKEDGFKDLLGRLEEEFREGLVSLEKRANERIDSQFNMFLMRIDGELTRRNRNRIETLARFEKVEAFCETVERDVARQADNQENITATLRKLAYFADMQSALNIQDEIDREWVSLFAGIDERTGFNKPQKLGEENNREKSQFHINRDCMGCTKNQETNLHLFKVACLKYESNPVSYQHKVLERKELLSLQKVITEMAVQNMEMVKIKIENIYNLPSPSRPGRLNSIQQFTMSGETIPLADREISEDDIQHHLSAKTMNKNEKFDLVTQVANSLEQQTGVLTTHGLEKAQNWLKDLKFDDKDLQDYAALNKRKNQIQKRAFGLVNKANSEAKNDRLRSTYKRRPLIQIKEIGSVNSIINGQQISYFEKSAMNNTFLLDKSQNHIRQDLKRTANLHLESAKTNDGDYNTFSSGFNSRAHSISDIKTNMAAPAVIQIGSQGLFREAITAANKADLYSQVPMRSGFNSSASGLKSRILQPLPPVKTKLARGNRRSASVSSDINQMNGIVNLDQTMERPDSRCFNRIYGTREHVVIVHNTMQPLETGHVGSIAGNTNTISVTQNNAKTAKQPKIKTKAKIVIPHGEGAGSVDQVENDNIDQEEIIVGRIGSLHL